MSTAQQFLTPVGRLVGGSLYKPSEKDGDGNLRVVKSGPNAGKPAPQYFFYQAIPKTPGQHWAQSEWGAKIWACGHAAFPVAAQASTFAWKVIDGDSQAPNTKGRRPCDNEGWPGHWVLRFTSGFAPKIYNADGTQQILEPDAVKPGYYIQVYGNCVSNDSMQRPGLHLNHNMVALAAYGTEINLGVDASAVGFGGGVALPAGASAVPLTQSFNPAPPGAAPMPGVPAAPAAAPYTPAPPIPGVPAIPGSAAAAPPLPPVPVAPNPGFLAPAAPVVPPVAPTAVAAPPRVRQMTAAAGGASYEDHIAAGWTDAMLIQHGKMLP